MNKNVLTSSASGVQRRWRVGDGPGPKIMKNVRKSERVFPLISGESLPIYCCIFDRYYVLKSSLLDSTWFSFDTYS